jgi:hypothetical protein
MIKAKQTLIDVGIVLALPLLVLAGLYFWSPNANDTALLSLVAPSQEPEFGAKARAALEKLKSITMDGSLFDDTVYLSLQEFHVDVEPAVLGRTYPFAPPDALLNLQTTKAQ